MAQVQLAGEFVVVWRLQNIEQGFEGYSTAQQPAGLAGYPSFLNKSGHCRILPVGTLRGMTSREWFASCGIRSVLSKTPKGSTF
jgi:hypothetical protein